MASRFCSSTNPLILVGRAGLEPATNWLKGLFFSLIFNQLTRILCANGSEKILINQYPVFAFAPRKYRQYRHNY